MKRAKRDAAKKAAVKKAKKGEAPPEKLYRPFEKLAKKDKPKPAPDKAPDARAADPKAKPSPAKPPPSRPGAPKSSRAAASHSSKPTAYVSPASKAQAEKAEQVHSRADTETFAIYMAGVRALEDKATRIPLTANRLERAAKGALPTLDNDAPAREQFQALVIEGIRFETSDDGERIEGRRIEVEPREVRRLRRGQYTVDQQIDLHGMTTHDARKAIEVFIEKRKKEGDRVLRIIHGKGGHSPRGISALRGEIAAWLSHGAAKRHIAAFATAPEQDGGTGAMLVLLMRTRS
jgi:DNA-nicking Smr family endonuclease